MVHIPNGGSGTVKGIVFIVLASAAIYKACIPGRLPYYRVSGSAQGTGYHVTYAARDSLDLSREVDSILTDFDRSLSTYLESSLISRVNRNEEAVVVDEHFIRVFRKAREVYETSGGYFDITIAPVVNAWGFGPDHAPRASTNSIDSLLQFVGMDKVRLAEGRVVKEHPAIQFDVNAIAQGYAVDVLAGYLDDLGIKNYLIELGGEVKTRGVNPSGQLWRVGIERPTESLNLIRGELQAVVELKNRSLATSGNYRNFYEEDGVKYSHTIDPKTGRPVRDRLLSATILTEECMDADAYATACMAMGLEKSKLFVQEHPDLEAYLIYSDEEGNFQVYMTGGMQRLICR